MSSVVVISSLATAVAAFVSVAIGAALGLAPGSTGTRALAPIHSFALVTAVAVVLGQLLPEALSALGLWALLVFAAAFALPRVLEAIRRRIPGEGMRPSLTADNDGPCTDVGLELSYAAFLLHRVGDGVGLALFAGPLHESHEHYDLILAIAAHTVPVTALVAMAYDLRHGCRSALFRTLWILVATGIGLLLPTLVEPDALHRYEPWITATVGGLLLHVVSHGWAPAGPPTRAGRAMDVAALLCAVALVALGGDSHVHEHGGEVDDLRARLGHALVELGLETAPMLLLGLAIAAFLQTQGARLSLRFLRSGNDLSQAVRGAALGLPLPVCACGILPVAHSLHRRGAAAAVVVAFLLATPELGVETFVLTGRFLGWPFAWLRLGAAFAVAVVAALLLAGRLPAESKTRPAGDDGILVPGALSDAGLARQVLANFDDLLYHIGAWTLVGLLAAAYMQAALTPGALAAVADSGLDVLVVSALAVPSYVCASSATPLAAVLLEKGLSPGAVLAGLLLGPATNLATVAWLRKAYGTRATVFAMVGLIGFCWVLSLGVNRVWPDVSAQVSVADAHAHSPASVLSSVVVLLFILRAVWRSGLRNWLSSLGEVLVVGDRDDAVHHGHSHHGHAHH